MPPVNLALLGTIVITAIVGGVVGYATHWLQTRHQRKWQKIDEAHKTAIQFVQRYQTSMLDIVTFLSMNEHGLLSENEVVKEISKITTVLKSIIFSPKYAAILLDFNCSNLSSIRLTICDVSPTVFCIKSQSVSFASDEDWRFANVSTNFPYLEMISW